jgi:hypothetical protein
MSDTPTPITEETPPCTDCVPAVRETQTIDVTIKLRDVILRNDQTMTVSREKHVYENGNETFWDVEYEEVPADAPIPADAMTLLQTRLGTAGA